MQRRRIKKEELHEINSRLDSYFEVREGDRLTVSYNGVKLSIGSYSTVETDGAIYSRTLEVGDDPVEQWDLIYSYLKKNALKEARFKLSTFVAELAHAKELARG